VFDRDANASPVFPEDTIVIAKNAMHFYGRPSFSQNGLHVQAEGLKKPVRSFRDLGINFENQGAEDALDMCENVPNLEDVASLFQCISGAEDALDVCEDVPNPEDAASLFQCSSGAEDALDMYEDVPETASVVFATDPRQIGKGRKIRKAKQCQRNAPYHGAATHSKAEVHKPNFASQGN
jgi:hypothetical protein